MGLETLPEYNGRSSCFLGVFLFYLFELFGANIVSFAQTQPTKGTNQQPTNQRNIVIPLIQYNNTQHQTTCMVQC